MQARRQINNDGLRQQLHSRFNEKVAQDHDE